MNSDRRIAIACRSTNDQLRTRCRIDLLDPDELDRELLHTQRKALRRGLCTFWLYDSALIQSLQYIHHREAYIRSLIDSTCEKSHHLVFNSGVVYFVLHAFMKHSFSNKFYKQFQVEIRWLVQARAKFFQRRFFVALIWVKLLELQW